MALKRARKRMEVDAAEIPMTPMIDVVFQLLIYFLWTIQPKDVIAHLDVFTPSPENTQEQPDTPPKMIRVMIFPDGYTINDRPVNLKNLDMLLTKLASFDRSQTILIMCSSLSPHRMLVQVLDLCAKSGLNNLSVVSTN
jgi:biopolymer transport protein ExbD